MSLDAAVMACLVEYADGRRPEAELERQAVKAVLKALKVKAPGHAVELRIPPYAAVQIVQGPRHRRGTPSAVVEMPAASLLRLATGETDWTSETEAGSVVASGERSDIRKLFPL